MILLQSNELTNHISPIIHLETQQHKNHFDLTIATIFKLTEAGVLDFGGSEFKTAQKREIKARKETDDDYGWWHLSGGMYTATMNEKIKEFEDTVALVAPHSHTQQAGIITNTAILSGEETAQAVTMNFRVPDIGCQIKENARFAVIYMLAN